MESGWRAADTVFTAPELQRRYPKVEVSLLTPKVALVPTAFFDEAKARETLSETVALGKDDEVGHIGLPEYAAELVYSLSIGEMLSRTISQAVLDGEGKAARILPEMYFILKDLQKVDEYNRIVASYAAGYLHQANHMARQRVALLYTILFRMIRLPAHLRYHIRRSEKIH